MFLQRLGRPFSKVIPRSVYLKQSENPIRGYLILRCFCFTDKDYIFLENTVCYMLHMSLKFTPALKKLPLSNTFYDNCIFKYASAVLQTCKCTAVSLLLIQSGNV